MSNQREDVAMMEGELPAQEPQVCDTRLNLNSRYQDNAKVKSESTDASSGKLTTPPELESFLTYKDKLGEGTYGVVYSA